MNNQDLPQETQEELKIKLEKLDAIKKVLIKNSKNDDSLRFLLKRF